MERVGGEGALLNECRESKQDFEEIHSRLRRGDIVGVTGKPGKGYSR